MTEQQKEQRKCALAMAIYDTKAMAIYDTKQIDIDKRFAPVDSGTDTNVGSRNL